MDQRQLLQREINAKIKSCIPNYAWESTVAIVIVVDQAIHQFGTGILFRVADYSFIVTAGHVVKRACEQDMTLGISSASNSFVAVSGKWLVTTEGQYGDLDDPFDIAIQKLSPDTVQRLGNLTYLGVSDISFNEPPRTALYTFFGYPTVMTRPSRHERECLVLRPFQFTTYSYDRDTDCLEGFQERFHLLLDAQPCNISSDDGSAAQFCDLVGRIAEFPTDLGGISGCSVWQIGDWNEPMDSWGRHRPRNVGVQTGVYSEKQVIKATRWIAVSTLIDQAFPELRPALALWRP